MKLYKAVKTHAFYIFIGITASLFEFANASESFISIIEKNLNPKSYNSKVVEMEDMLNINLADDDIDFYTYKIPGEILNAKANIYGDINIKSVTLNKKSVTYKLKKINERQFALVIGKKGNFFSKGENIFRINYTLDYSHYKDVGVIRKFTNKFIKEEGSLPVRKVILKVNAPPMSKIERVDYKNTIDGKAANNYVVEGSLDSVKMQSSSDISNKESMRLNAVIGKVVTTYWGQDISTLFPTLPIDNDYYRICFSLLSIVVLSKFVLMLLESLMQSRRPREYVVAIRNVLVSFSGIVNLFGLREEKEYKCKYK